MADNEITKLVDEIKAFSKERNWEQFHSPKNLSMALAGEAGELLEIFQWLSEEQSKVNNIDQETLELVKEELGDIFIYLLNISDKLKIDLFAAAKDKMKKNAEKYPISQSRDNATKYNRRNG